MQEDFLLTTKLARQLYHDCAARLPLIDYHNHLSVTDLAANRQYGDLAEMWLLSDPYKHRAMRICGIDEQFITGEADPYAKFQAWCSIYPDLIGNPLYHWSAIELERFFGITLPINARNAAEIWQTANALLTRPEFKAQGLLERFAVAYFSPCTPIAGDLSPFASFQHIVPSLRCDDLLPLSADVIHQLAVCTGIRIDSLDRLLAALTRRLDCFQAAGCRFADHALDNGFIYVRDDGNNETRLQKIIQGGACDESDRRQLISLVLRWLGQEYARRRWVMQLHIGALRNTSTRLRAAAGPAGGFAGIGSVDITALTGLLDDIEQGDAGLPRVVLFNINPTDNAALSILSGSYCSDGRRGKVQQGPAWWWCDHLHGMRDLLESISAYGVLSAFIGMTTDSRSILSLVRHDYFRRTLCGWIGEKAARGEFPNDWETLAHLVSSICFGNARAILAESGWQLPANTTH